MSTSSIGHLSPPVWIQPRRVPAIFNSCVRGFAVISAGGLAAFGGLVAVDTICAGHEIQDLACPLLTGVAESPSPANDTVGSQNYR